MAGIKGEIIYDENGKFVSATGGLKAAATVKAKHGKDYYKSIGSIGGSVKGVKKGFATNPELARIAGAKGGRISKRRPANKDAK